MELERYREELISSQSEAEQLRELLQGGQTNALMNTIEHLQVKELKIPKRRKIERTSADQYSHQSPLTMLPWVPAARLHM